MGPFYDALRASTKILVSALLGDSPFELATHEATVLSACQDYTSLHDVQFKQQFDYLLGKFYQLHQWVILCTCANHLSGWLTAVPTAQDHFDLSA